MSSWLANRIALKGGLPGDSGQQALSGGITTQRAPVIKCSASHASKRIWRVDEKGGREVERERGEEGERERGREGERERERERASNRNGR